MNVPQLRFDGFNEEWEVKKLSDVAIIKGGFAFPSQRFRNEKSNYQVIKMGNLYNNKLDLDRSPSYLESISNRDQEYLLNEGDIIITLTGTVHKTDFGYSHMITNEKNLLVNQRLALVKSKVNSDSFFLLNLIRHKRFLLQFFTSSIGGTGNQANVSTKTMEGFSIVIPSLLEQKKISAFFRLLNNKISKQQEKIEKLEQFKKGMMQKIFSQELRFKDEGSCEFLEWEETTFGKVITTFSGGTPLSNNPKYYSGDIPFIRSGEIYTDKTELFITEEALKNSSAKMVNKGDLLLALYGANSGEIAVSKINGAINQAILCIRTEQLLSFLMYYWEYKKENILKTYLQGGQGNISASIVKNIELSLPNIKEQIKIGNYFENLEKKIDKEKEKLMVLEEQKKGFMQGMFV